MPATREGTPLAVQPTEGGVWIEAGDDSALHGGLAQPVAERGRHAPAAGPLVVTPNLLENDYLRVELNDDGDITRIYDKVQRA